jgi:two-component system sensor histidine kinase YesM
MSYPTYNVEFEENLMFKKHIPIRMKIVLAMLTSACVPLGIVAGILLYQVSQQIQGDLQLVKQRAEQDIKDKIELYDQNFFETAYRIYSSTDLLVSLENDTEYAPDNSTSYNSLSDTSKVFQNIYYNSKVNDIVGLFLVNSHREMVGHFVIEPPNNYESYVGNMVTDLHVVSGQRSYIRFIDKRFYTEPVMQYVYPVKFHGKFVGTLIIDVKESYFRNMVEHSNTFYKGKVVITDQASRILYHTDAEEAGKTINLSEKSGHQVYIETPLKAMNWKLIYIYFISPRLLLIRNLAFSIVGVSFFLAIGFSLYLGYSITKPIIHLHRKMGKIQFGDYSARVTIKSNDEIGYLGNQFNRMAETIQELIEKDLRLQLINKETHISALQAQISPHFLYNTLQTMTSIAMVNHVPEIRLICQSLGNMYRYNMDITNESVRLQDEVMHVRNYLVIINKRYPEQIRIRFHTDQAARDWKVPKLILQPIVENAVEHGLIPSRRDRKLIKVSIKTDMKNGVFYLVVLDNGKGIPQQAVQEINQNLHHSSSKIKTGVNSNFSIGLSNIQTRIHLLYGEEFGLILQSKLNKGTCVTFKLPLA